MQHKCSSKQEKKIKREGARYAYIIHSSLGSHSASMNEEKIQEKEQEDYYRVQITTSLKKKKKKPSNVF